MKKVLTVVALLLASVFAQGTVPQPTIQQAEILLFHALETYPGMIGVGISEVKDKPSLIVYMDCSVESPDAIVPHSYAGYPVSVYCTDLPHSQKESRHFIKEEYGHNGN